MNQASKAELAATGLGWPEGPTLQRDGSVVFVESYRSQLSVYRDGKVSRLAYTAGAPNSCVVGAKGELYVCQNGGTVGPWRAAEMTVPSIQRVEPGGRP
jgi:gluconolactonase